MNQIDQTHPRASDLRVADASSRLGLRSRGTFRGSKSRGAFTLIELLVVITIIAILAGILTVSVYSAIIFVTGVTISFELKELEMAVTQYNQKNGSYPPGMGADYQFVQRHINSAFRNHREPAAMFTDGSGNPGVTPLVNTSEYTTWVGVWPELEFATMENLDASETLPYFLGGAAQFSQAKGCGNALGLKQDPVLPLTGSSASAAVSIYEFELDQLVDLDGDGFPSYIPKNTDGQTPFVYFAAHLYKDSTGLATPLPASMAAVRWPPANAASGDPGNYDNWMNGLVTGVPGGYDPGVVRPYLNAGVTPNDWYEENGFQLLSAGLDNAYGSDGLLDGGADPVFPKDVVGATPTNKGSYKALSQGVFRLMDPEDEDNLANFTEGGTFGSVGLE